MTAQAESPASSAAVPCLPRAAPPCRPGTSLPRTLFPLPLVGPVLAASAAAALHTLLDWEAIFRVSTTLAQQN